MSKTSNRGYKTLVVGVIVLFIGLGVQPAIATVEPDVDITDKSDVESLVSQIRNVVNKVLQKYGHIPTVRNLANMILNTLDLDSNIIYCIALIIIAIPLFLIVSFNWIFLEHLGILALILTSILMLYSVECSQPPSIFNLPFKFIYTMLETKDNINTFDGCPCLQE